MKKNSFRLLILIPTVILTACSSQTFYKFDPLEEKEFYKGREIAIKEDDNARVSVEFDSYINGEISFYVQIKNKSNLKVLFDPKEVYISTADEYEAGIETGQHNYFALDPEKEIDEISKEVEQRNSLHAAITGINIAFAVINVAGDIADNRSRHKARKVADDIAVWADNQNSEEIDYNNSMNNLDSKSEFWKNEVFRITDLHGSEEMGGLIFIPINDKLQHIKVVVPFGENIYSFLFGKVQIDLRN